MCCISGAGFVCLGCLIGFRLFICVCLLFAYWFGLGFALLVLRIVFVLGCAVVVSGGVAPCLTLVCFDLTVFMGCSGCLLFVYD